MAIKSNRLKRLIVAIVLVLTSLVIGVVGGVKIASINKVTSTDDKSHIQQLADILSENWYSEIFYGKEADEDLLIHQFIGALSTGESRMLDPYTFLIKNEEGQTGIVAGKIGITMNYFYNYPIITEVHKDGPAYNRILPGDIIVQTGKVVDTKTGKESETGLPKSNVLYYDLEDDAWCCVRPSGTEPKIKFYFGVKAPLASVEEFDKVQAELDAKLEALKVELKLV